MKFLTDDIYRLSGNQRARLQYHILAQRFPLVPVSTQDEEDLKAFCASHRAETARRWLNRMEWENGLAKLVTFGVSLEVRRPPSFAAAPWCYSARLDKQSAAYQGFPMTWEEWLAPVRELLDRRRVEFKTDTSMTAEQRAQLAEDTYNAAIMMLFYQKGHYMTIPGEDCKRLKEWVYQYFYGGAAPLPPLSEITDGDCRFEIDFDRDIEIVEAPNLREGMSQYNQTHNAEHNKAMGRAQTEKRFENLCGDSWTTQEILAQGFSRKTLDTFVKHGLIERVKRGYYVRKSV